METAMKTTPDYAASIWMEGHSIHMMLPPIHGQDGHTVEFKDTEAGWAALRITLKDRETYSRSRARIGTPPAPVQHDIDLVIKALAAGKAITHVGTKKKFDDSITLDDLEFDMEDLK